MAHPGSSAPVDADAVTYRAPKLIRVVFPSLWALTGATGTIVQLRHGQLPWQLAYVVLGVTVAWLANKTVVVADRTGVLSKGRKLTPWSQVAELDRPPDTRWTYESATLVLNDGSRRPLRRDLTADHLDRMDRWLQASRGTEPPADD